MKYAILEHGGKQYLAEEGGRIEVDRMSVEVGNAVEFNEVLLVSDGSKVDVGSPYVSGATVKGKILKHSSGEKIRVFKHKAKERYRRSAGQRRRLTRIEVEAVGMPGASEDAPPRTKKATPRKTVKRATAAKRTATKAPAKTKRGASKAKPARPKKK